MIYYLCATQPTNLGDLFINKVLIDELSSHGVVYVDCHRVPEQFQTYLFKDNKNVVNINTSRHFSLKKLDIIRFLRFVKKNQIRIYVQSPGPISYRWYVRHTFSFINKILSHYGIKTLNIGNCCSSQRYLGKPIHNVNLHKYYLRSEASVNYANSYLPNRASYIPDLAFLAYDEGKTYNKEKIAAISLRDANDDTELLMSWLDKSLPVLISKGYKIHLFYQVASDKDFMLKIYDRFKHIQSISFIEKQLWYDDLDFYGKVDIVISNRLHVLLLGAIHDSIPLALVNDDDKVAKVQDVFDTAFAENSSLFCRRLKDGMDISQIIEKRDDYRHIIRQVVHRNSVLCHKTIKNIVVGISGIHHTLPEAIE